MKRIIGKENRIVAIVVLTAFLIGSFYLPVYAITSAEGRTVTYQYTFSSKLISKTTNDTEGLGWTKVEYNGRGGVSRVTTNDGTMQWVSEIYTYDEAGRVETAQHYKYDPLAARTYVSSVDFYDNSQRNYKSEQYNLSGYVKGVTENIFYDGTKIVKFVVQWDDMILPDSTRWTVTGYQFSLLENVIDGATVFTKNTPSGYAAPTNTLRFFVSSVDKFNALGYAIQGKKYDDPSDPTPVAVP